MATPRADVIANLTHFADGQITQDFNQSQNRIDSHIAGGQIDEGFCKGVCIDWARRVIGGAGGGKPAFTTSAQRLEPQTFRQGNIQFNLESRNSDHNALVGVLNQLIEAWNAQLNQQTIQISPGLYTALQTYFTFAPEPGHRYTKTRVQDWKTRLKERADRLNHKTTVGWAAFVGLMDQMHSENRDQQDRGVSNRRFSSIRIIESSDRTYFPNIDAGIDGLVTRPAYVAGTVMLLGFGLTDNGNPTGHAVAAFSTNNGRYQFLDPNYGIFPCDQTGLRSSLRYLFGTQYGTPIYGEDNDTVTGYIDHILFGPA